jgi:hypothetical protein
MSEWTTWPVKRFAIDFAGAEVKLRGAIACAKDGQAGLARVLAEQASDLLSGAFDNLPIEVQGEILEIRAKFDDGKAPTKPPVRQTKRDD